MGAETSRVDDVGAMVGGFQSKEVLKLGLKNTSSKRIAAHTDEMISISRHHSKTFTFKYFFI